MLELDRWCQVHEVNIVVHQLYPVVLKERRETGTWFEPRVYIYIYPSASSKHSELNVQGTSKSLNEKLAQILTFPRTWKNMPISYGSCDWFVWSGNPQGGFWLEDVGSVEGGMGESGIIKMLLVFFGGNKSNHAANVWSFDVIGCHIMKNLMMYYCTIFWSFWRICFAKIR